MLVVEFFLSVSRLLQIYSHIIPPWLDYKILKLRGRILNWSSERAAFEETKFHERTACKAFVGICTLGGFFIKKGQQLLLKKGLMPPQYYDALKPLLADVPERPFLVMAKVFHDSTGKSLSEVFETINPNCIGAASLAQTYVGVLRPEYRAGKEARKVIVKIQYPEVRAYFALDLRIILRLCNSFFPRMYEANKAAQEQHLRELDMWNEAQTLERMGRAMARAGLSPHKVVVPQPARCLTSRKTLVMDFLPGVTFDKFVDRCSHELKQLFGPSDWGVMASRAADEMNSKEEQINDSCDTRIHIQPPSELLKLAAATAKIIEGNIFDSVTKLQNLVLGLSKSRQVVADYHKIILILQVLVEALGYQCLIEGCVNVDSHPGNVICMDDGRVGLIDFGQVGYLNDEERLCVAKIILAIRNYDRDATCAAMRSLPPDGFRCKDDNDVVVERWAIFAFDRVDLSPLHYDDAVQRPIPAMLHHRVTVFPNAYLCVRRVSEILLSSTLMFGGKIMPPLSTAWGSLAEQVVKETEDTEMKKASEHMGLKLMNFVLKVRRKSFRSKLVNDGYRKSKKTLGLDIIEGAVRLERPIQSRLKNEERLARGAMPIFAPAIEHAPQTRGNEPRFNRHSWRRSVIEIERIN